MRLAGALTAFTSVAYSKPAFRRATPVYQWKLVTEDPDRGDTHTYQLVAGAGDADNNQFKITESMIATGPHFKPDQAIHMIRLRTTDSAGLFYEASFMLQPHTDPIELMQLPLNASVQSSGNPTHFALQPSPYAWTRLHGFNPDTDVIDVVSFGISHWSSLSRLDDARQLRQTVAPMQRILFPDNQLLIIYTDQPVQPAWFNGIYGPLITTSTTTTTTTTTTSTTTSTTTTSTTASTSRSTPTTPSTSSISSTGPLISSTTAIAPIGRPTPAPVSGGLGMTATDDGTQIDGVKIIVSCIVMGAILVITYQARKHLPYLGRKSAPVGSLFIPDSMIDPLIQFVLEHHPPVRDHLGELPRENRAIPISAYIRRSGTDPTAFLNDITRNCDHGPREIRPATAVGVLRDISGDPITTKDGVPVAIGLLGDAFQKNGKPGTWSERGELIFKNTALFLTAQKCDIASVEITLNYIPGGVDIKSFKYEMTNKPRPTHIEGEWKDDYTSLYAKMVRQAQKATGQVPLGCFHTGTGIPKNAYSDYVSSFQAYGVIPHNEAFMLLTPSDIQAVGINTHSKRAFRNSLLLYQNTVSYLLSHGEYELAQQIVLAIYNNRTGQIKRVDPVSLRGLYELTPDSYTIRHGRIHPDERPSYGD